jgi:outer membrane protein TolC
MKRSDMVTLTVAMNLPVWRETKTEPRIAQAVAMRGQAVDLLHAQQHDVTTKLHHQIAAALQNLKSLRLYERDILPVARLTLEAALSAYQVNRIDFMTLLDNQMSVFNYEISSITARVGYHKAIAEMDFLTGKLAVDALGPADKTGEEP